jgi:hypothetical protein
VNAPFASAHDLWAYYHAAKPTAGSLAGVGGAVVSSNITVRKLRLGSATLENVYGDLTQAASGVEADPSFAANLGEGVFRNFTFVLDYAHQQVYFAPGGIHDMSGVLFARRGNSIIVRQVLTHRAQRAGVRVGMILTSLNGQTVDGRDLAAVRALLQDKQPGTAVEMVFDRTKHVTLDLLNYL